MYRYRGIDDEIISRVLTMMTRKSRDRMRVTASPPQLYEPLRAHSAGYD